MSDMSDDFSEHCKSLKLISRFGAHSVPDLQLSCRDWTWWVGSQYHSGNDLVSIRQHAITWTYDYKDWQQNTIQKPKSWYNSLCQTDTTWHHRTWSTLVLVMACCLTAPTHYLSQRWLISQVLWHSPEGNITGNRAILFRSHWDKWLASLLVLAWRHINGSVTSFEPFMCWIAWI